MTTDPTLPVEEAERQWCPEARVAEAGGFSINRDTNGRDPHCTTVACSRWITTSEGRGFCGDCPGKVAMWRAAQESAHVARLADAIGTAIEQGFLAGRLNG